MRKAQIQKPRPRRPAAAELDLRTPSGRPLAY